MKAAAATLRVGTRASRLARWQTDAVMAALQALHPGLRCTAVEVSTAGDRDETTPLPALGGRGVFTDALEGALRAGDVDLAVHSLKDMPVEESPGLVLGAVGRRADVRDVLIARDGWTLATLPAGARVGTCSTRRSAQLLAARPDLTLVSLRGNVDTRVRRALEGAYDAILIAAAGVLRLGLGDTISEYLPLDVVLPAPGQGALAVQCRADDVLTRGLLAALDEPDVRAAADAERAFLEGLGGGCAAPIAAHGAVGRRQGTPWLELRGLVASLDGRQAVRVATAGPATRARELGLRLALDACERGAAGLLA
jgi:hydroxymethylbilane synthase